MTWHDVVGHRRTLRAAQTPPFAAGLGMAEEHVPGRATPGRVTFACSARLDISERYSLVIGSLPPARITLDSVPEPQEEVFIYDADIGFPGS